MVSQTVLSERGFGTLKRQGRKGEKMVTSTRLSPIEQFFGIDSAQGKLGTCGREELVIAVATIPRRDANEPTQATKLFFRKMSANDDNFQVSLYLLVCARVAPPHPSVCLLNWDTLGWAEEWPRAISPVKKLLAPRPAFIVLRATTGALSCVQVPRRTVRLVEDLAQIIAPRGLATQA